MKLTYEDYISRRRIRTPSRKRAVASLSRRSYKAAASNIATSKLSATHVLNKVTQQIRTEMSDICSDRHKSMLKKSDEAIKAFSWQELIAEFKQWVPTLFKLLKKILPKSDEQFLAFFISMLLKKRSKFMSLVQRVVSVMLYGNATHKQVSNNY